MRSNRLRGQMKIVVAPDSFKGTLSAYEAASLIAKAAKECFPEAQVISVPLADGGEGSLACFRSAIGGNYVPVKVCNPYLEPIEAKYLLKDDLAVIEIAECVGLPLVEGRKHVRLTSTYGVGEIIRDALDKGVKEIVLALGGSSTNDGGAGMAVALGARFTDEEGMPILPTGGTLEDIYAADFSELDKRIGDVKFTAMCDVNVPLCGEDGATYVFAPQKGAAYDELEALDKGMRHYGEILNAAFGIDVFALEGGGAAGGLGAGAFAILNAEPERGIDLVLRVTDFGKTISDADMIVTGEGRLDKQSFMGKAADGISRIAQAHGVPVYVIAGAVADDVTASLLTSRGIVAAMATSAGDRPLFEIADSAQKDLYETAKELFKAVKEL